MKINWIRSDDKKRIETDAQFYLESVKEFLRKYENSSQVFEHGNGIIPPFRQYIKDIELIESGHNLYLRCVLNKDIHLDLKIIYEEIRIFENHVEYVLITTSSSIGIDVTDEKEFKYFVSIFNKLKGGLK